jgi:archaemetzincin
MQPIYVWWIGEEEPERELVEHVRLHLARAFRRPAEIWASDVRPRNAFDPRRRQHASGVILRWLLEAGPPTGKVLGVTDRDLFIPILTYVFGEAQLGGRAAVVSTARLMEDVELVGPGLLVERLAKEAVHEVGHAYGLVHFDAEECVMARSPAVREVDAKSSEPCAECRARLQGTHGEG